MKQALLLVDIQLDYFKGGAMELVEMEEAAKKAQYMLGYFRETGWPVFHVRHLALKRGATFFLPDTPGAEIHSLVLPTNGEIVVEKHYPNSFRETTLLESLRKQNIDSLAICGAMSHMCIDATTRAAYDHGFQCTVIEDACTTRDLLFKGVLVSARIAHSAFMAALQNTYAQITTARDFSSQ